MTLTIGYKRDPPQLRFDHAEEWMVELPLTGAATKKVILGMYINNYTEKRTLISRLQEWAQQWMLSSSQEWMGTQVRTQDALHKLFS